VVESYKLGVNAYVVKPVAFADFVAAVRNLGLFWAVLISAPRERAAEVPKAAPNRHLEDNSQRQGSRP